MKKFTSEFRSVLALTKERNAQSAKPASSWRCIVEVVKVYVQVLRKAA